MGQVYFGTSSQWNELTIIHLTLLTRALAAVCLTFCHNDMKKVELVDGIKMIRNSGIVMVNVISWGNFHSRLVTIIPIEPEMEHESQQFCSSSLLNGELSAENGSRCTEIT